MKRRSWLKTTLCVLLACAVLGTIVSGIIFAVNKDKAYAYATIEFSFDGAAEGIAPNGYAFSILDIKSDAVLGKAIAAAGLEGKVTPADVRLQMETTGVYPENIVEQMTSYESLLDFSANREVMATVYHPTLYSVVLYNGFEPKLSDGELKKLLECVMDTYRTWFAEAYAAGANDIAVSYNLDDYDYPQQLTILTRLMEESAAYAEAMYEKEPTLAIGGKGFNNIAVRLHNLIDTEIARLSANVTINALTQKPKRLITQYQYEIDNLKNQLEKKTAQLEKIDALLAFYQKYEIIYLSTTDSLTKIDGNSSETYDKLVEERKAVADEITVISTSIDTYTQRLKDLTGETEEPETTGAAAPAAPAGKTDEPVEDKKDTAGSEEQTAEDGAVTEEEVAPSLSEEELAAMAEAAEQASKQAVADLEADIDHLLAVREEIMKDFAALISLYNEQQINDMTVTVSVVKIEAPRLLSGAFAKQTLKVAGPFCAVGFMVCLVLIIISRRKEEKK